MGYTCTNGRYSNKPSCPSSEYAFNSDEDVKLTGFLCFPGFESRAGYCLPRDKRTNTGIFKEVKTIDEIDLCFRKTSKIFDLIYGESHPFVSEYIKKQVEVPIESIKK